MTDNARTLKRGDTIGVDGREWRDKVNGTSYCSVRVYVNGYEVGRVPFGYGYGDAYKQYALELLASLKIVSPEKHHFGGLKISWRELRDDYGIILHSKITSALKRQTTEWGYPE